MSSDEEMVIVTKKKYKINSILSDDESGQSCDSNHLGSPVKKIGNGIDKKVNKKRKKNKNTGRKLYSSSETGDDDFEQETVNSTSTFNHDECKSNNLNNSLKVTYNTEDGLTEDSSTEDDLKSSAENKTSVLGKESSSNNKAQNAIEEIHKQSQRMLREAHISIPYHRPRQRTLMEFKERKKATPTISLHTSADQLVSAWKAIEQREKEAEDFYKSDVSDDETQNEETNLCGDMQEAPVFLPLNDVDGNTSPNAINQHSNLVSEGQVSTDILNYNRNKECDLLTLDNCVTEPKIIASNENKSREGIHTEKNMINDSGQKISAISLSKLELGCVGQVLNDQSLITSDQSQIPDNILPTYFNDQLIENEDSSNMSESLICEVSASKNLVNTEDYSLRLSESQSESSKLNDDNLSCKIHAEDDLKSHGVKNVCKSVTHESNIKDFSNVLEDDLKSHMISNCCKNFTHENNINDFSNISEDIFDKAASQNVRADSEIQDSCEDIKFVQCDENINRQKACNKNCDESASLELSCERHKVVDKNSSPCKNSVPGEEYTKESKLHTQYKFYSSKSIINYPKISGSCEKVIDLDEGLVKPGVNGLIERFYTHLSYKRKPVKKKTPLELRVIKAETDASGHVSSLDEEILKVVVNNEEEEADPSLTKPGAKFARLKAHLQAEMGKQREVEWCKKHQEQRLYEEELFEGEENICDVYNEEKENKGSDEDQSDEEGDDDGDSDDDETGEDEIESDELEEKNPKKRNMFLDDEAEESEDNDCLETGADVCSAVFIKRPPQNKVVLKRTDTTDMFSSQETFKYHYDEEELTSFQKPLAPDEKAEEVEESESAVCPSPAFRLTALEGKDGTDRYNWSEPTTPCKELVSPKLVTPVRTIAQLVDNSPLVGSQDLENLCSGQFSSQPLPVNEDNTPQDFELFLAEDSQISQVQTTPLKTIPVTLKDTAERQELSSLLVDNDDDDDDDDDDAVTTNVVSKQVKKLNFSDDEDTSQTVHEENSDEESNHEDKKTIEDVAYDSEENEVVNTVGEFLDKEAELSESEWSSEDEDEYGLDTLEMEEADKEKINQRKLKQELDQLHMKQMLIEDKKEVRLLQEMLLEDGELHTEGRRQRLFRWSNDINGEEGIKGLFDSDEDKDEEDEDEENWRRTRHEREQYLKEHSKKKEKLELVIEEESDSQLLKLGQNALKRMNITSQEAKLSSTVNSLISPVKEKSNTVMMKRGSFLSRGQQVLSRLAQMVATNTDAPLNQPKNSRNFVFASVSPTKEEEKIVEPIQQTNKRKLPVLPLPMAKKPCVKKPTTVNKKSLFEELFKIQR